MPLLMPALLPPTVHLSLEVFINKACAPAGVHHWPCWVSSEGNEKLTTRHGPRAFETNSPFDVSTKSVFVFVVINNTTLKEPGFAKALPYFQPIRPTFFRLGSVPQVAPESTYRVIPMFDEPILFIKLSSIPNACSATAFRFPSGLLAQNIPFWVA